MAPSRKNATPATVRLNPFRRAVIRGLGVLLPPLLTIVIFVWIGNTVAVYLLEPLETQARSLIFRNKYASQILPLEAAARGVGDDGVVSSAEGTLQLDSGKKFRLTGDDKYVPEPVYLLVQEGLDNEPMPPTARGIYERYIDLVHLQRHVVIPLFLAVFILVLYLLGKFLAAGMGRFFWAQFERIIHRLPLIRNVYSSVKQVTDFLFNEREVEYTRVVAVEYPRKGIWSLAMVTGESFLDIRGAANEPVLAVLVPTSPMPLTGFTVTVKKSETVDLNITIDQAVQFIVSCGVVVPPEQLSTLADGRDIDAINAVQRPVPALAAQKVGAD
jgi:uncharacterized membrane protein